MRFAGLDISYDARVLEPRPWTVAQSEWAAELSSAAGPGPLLELCCGAGHIGLAAAVLTGRTLHQVDDDPLACAYARHNARVAGREHSVEVYCGALDGDVLPNGRYPLILADPPYLTPAEARRYPHDPPHAVAGGTDGLDVVRRCLTVIAHRLEPDGFALLQLRDEPQIDAVNAIVAAGGLCLRTWDSRHLNAERAILALRRSQPTECRRS
jgi:release factor glutamine methyltransferase